MCHISQQLKTRNGESYFILTTIDSPKIIRWNKTMCLFFKLTYLLKLELFTLQYCSGFCHTLTWISHRYTCVPHPEPPAHLPPNLIPQGHPSSPVLSSLSHALNLDWQSVSHMIINMFQCYSLKSSHPSLLPQSPKDVLYICVSFAVSHIELSLPSF